MFSDMSIQNPYKGRYNKVGAPHLQSLLIYNVQIQNIKYKIIRPKQFFKRYIYSFIRFRSSCVIVRVHTIILVWICVFSRQDMVFFYNNNSNNNTISTEHATYESSNFVNVLQGLQFAYRI